MGSALAAPVRSSSRAVGFPPVRGRRSHLHVAVVRPQPQAAPARHRPRAATYWCRRAAAVGVAGAVLRAVWVALGALGGGPLPVPARPGQSTAAGATWGAVYVVQPGDTVWSIARRLQPSGDPRPLVDRLVAAHSGATLHVGERLPLPARR
jgi:Tfp pilus assembly protein FimV